MHRPLFLITAGSVAAVGALVIASALPAGGATAVRAETMARTVADPSAATPVTFSLTTIGVLAITAPTATVDLGSGVAHNVGATIGSPGNFGSVTVTDNRGLSSASWTATVSATDFTNSVSSNIIPVNDATYITGNLIPVGPGSTATVLNATLTLTGGAQDVVTENGFDGNNAVTWTPTIYVSVPASAVIGIYDGTVTHSVS